MVGLALAVGSWFLRWTHDWWSAILSNAAVVFLLLVPGEAALSRLRSQFRQVEVTADRAESFARSAMKTADEAAQSLEVIREKIIARQRAEFQAELDAYQSIASNPSRENLVGALKRATKDGLITEAGVRSPVWETNLHYRFIIDDEREDLVVRLEHDDGEVISSVPWQVGMPPEDFYQHLLVAVRDAGGDRGTGRNDTTRPVEELSKMLVEVTERRSQALSSDRHTLERIIEKRKGWYFTERLIAPADRLYHTIAVDRLSEVDWERHLSTSPSYAAPGTIKFAQALYGISSSPTRVEGRVA
jgi:hypothetical protein